MGRAPCCDKANVKKGPWSPEEDAKLKAYIEQYGTGGNWIALPQKIGLKRCGKSCRLRWLNYLRPNIKHGGFSEEEDNIICNLYISIGSRWSIIAAQLPGRTDNDIKNYWNTRLKKKLLGRHKQSNINRCPNASGAEENSSSHNLCNSALERLQLHMERQCLKDPLFFYNNPTLWPKLHPLHEKMLLQSLSEASYNNTLIHKQLTETCALDPIKHDYSNLDNYEVDTSEKAINAMASSGSQIDSLNNCNNVMASNNLPVSNNFQAALEDLLNDKTLGYMQQSEKIPDFDCFNDMINVSKDSLVWWSNEIETKLASSNNSWDFTSVIQPHGIFQDYGLGYNM